MTAYIVLLRAVNVGGTGKLPMAELKSMCVDEGFEDVKTYIASGNVVLRSDRSKAQVKETIEARLKAYAGKPVGVIVRTEQEIADILERDPFRDCEGSKVAVLFTDDTIPEDASENVTGQKSEEVRAGKNELFIHYPDGMGRTKLRIPLEKTGTARNMNTVRKLAQMAAALE